jgi:hypothetical protein
MHGNVLDARPVRDMLSLDCEGFVNHKTVVADLLR